MKRVIPVVVIAVTMTLAPSAGASGGPLDEARRAAERASFNGRLAVSWVDGSARHQTSVTMRCDHGAITIDGPVPIVKTLGSHLVRLSGGWTDLAPAGTVRQPATGKYTVRRASAPALVAGRPTDALEIFHGTRLRERMAIDHELGVVLRREQVGDRGEVVRRVEFTSFEPTPGATGGRVPKRYAAESSSVMGTRVPAPYRAPASLAGGYQRVGVYRRGAVVHVVYGDGVYGLSVFEQPGRLDWDQLPATGRAPTVHGRRARSYVWPGGRLLTWEAGGSTFTVVGDGPAREVLAAAASLRGAPPLSAGQRLRQTARELVETLSGKG
jgi:hypothetical protein